MKKNNLTGIMFHHFHDNLKHPNGQGSINVKQLTKIINFLGKKNILDPEDALEHIRSRKQNQKFCLTFDDGLKCQFDLALKVLKKFNLKGIFFIFSSILTSSPDLLEVYRHFRNTKYKNVSEFYLHFFKVIYKNNQNKIDLFLNKNKKFIRKIKKESPYYSLNDIKFRILRDKFLGKFGYENVMLKLFKLKNYNFKKYSKILYMNKKDIKKLEREGHMIGLHSHNHSSNILSLNLKNQILEFKKNKKLLSKCLKKKIKVASYPFGNFNKNTIKALKQNNIEFAFKKNLVLSKIRNYSNFQIPRENHITILKKIKVK